MWIVKFLELFSSGFFWESTRCVLPKTIWLVDSHIHTYVHTGWCLQLLYLLDVCMYVRMYVLYVCIYIYTCYYYNFNWPQCFVAKMTLYSFNINVQGHFSVVVCCCWMTYSLNAYARTYIHTYTVSKVLQYIINS